jgi:hypothetical protein
VALLAAAPDKLAIAVPVLAVPSAPTPAIAPAVTPVPVAAPPTLAMDARIFRLLAIARFTAEITQQIRRDDKGFAWKPEITQTMPASLKLK